MKLATALTSIALIGTISAFDVPLKAFTPSSSQAFAAEMKDATGLTAQEKINKLIASKGQFGSGDQLRRYFFGDLEPIGIQPGGAGMVVNLYNKAHDVTISYCSTYDVVVAVKKGRVTQFMASEVK